MGKVKHLVVDTSAFIKNTQLQDLGDNIVTVEEVVNEIKDTRQLRRLVVLPYDLQVEDVDAEHLRFVTDFSKKTGDYPSLSATDLKVVALTYKLHLQHVGDGELHQEPVCPKSVELVDHSVINSKEIAGFYTPDNEDDDNEEEEETDESKSRESDDEIEQEVPQVDDALIKGLTELKCEERDVEEDGEDDEDEGFDPGCDQKDPCALDDDDAGWITPSNLAKAKKESLSGAVDCDGVIVACVSTDFAIQNVLKQIGLNVVSIDGLLIKQVRTFVLRCYACFKTTSIMEKLFCPKCGNKTLKRVAVTVDDEGKQHLHINFKRPLTARGKRFPLPRFRGGKHSNNPILSEDQRVPHQRPSKLAMTKTNPLHPDYIAGVSPFIMRDVTSKSAMLGIQGHGEIKSWMRRNPNEVVKRKRKK